MIPRQAYPHVNTGPLMSEAILGPPKVGYDPTVVLSPWIVRCNLNLEYIEKGELLPDTWQDDNSLAEPGQASRRAHCLFLINILQWLEAFSRLVAVLCTRYLGKAAKFWAYQTSILKAAKSYEGTAWVAYDRQYRHEALARWDLVWLACNTHLYSKAFTGSKGKSHPTLPVLPE